MQRFSQASQTIFLYAIFACLFFLGAVTLLVHPSQVEASGLGVWATTSAAGNDDTWNSITYGNGRFVAVGSNGDRVMYSTDGITWATTSAAGNNDTWLSVTYGNGRFVAVGSGPGTDRVMYSSDGITWATTSAAGNNDEWDEVIYGNGRFVAVGNGNLGSNDSVMHSTDGITWATTSSAQGVSDAWYGLAYGNGRFVAVGATPSGHPVMHSTNGITWATSSAAGNNDNWGAITFGNGRFVAVGDGTGGGIDVAMYSIDGITWATTSAAGNNDAWVAVTYGNGRFVAVGYGPDEVMYSTDGINWATAVGLGNFEVWDTVGYGNGRFVALNGGGGSRIMTATSTHPITQSGFRFRDDNGSETGATYLNAQNANTTAPVNDPLRLRTQIEATDENVVNRYQVQYKKPSDVSWNTVGLDGDFPTIVATSTSRTTGDTTSHAVTMPSCDVGNLLLTIFSYDGTGPATSSATSTGWQKMGELTQITTTAVQVSSALFWKVAESSNTLAVNTAITQESSHIVYCIRNAGTPIALPAEGSSTNSNPPRLSLGVDRNVLWIAARAGDAQVAATVAPSGYTGLTNITANTTNGATTNSAHAFLFASATDPGTFTSATEQWIAWTIAVPPRDTPVARNFVATSRATTTGSNVTSFGSIAWTNPTQASSSNDLRASVTLSSTTASNHLYLTNWGFNIPTSATIQGVEVFLEKLQSGGTTGNARDNNLRLVVNGTSTGNNLAQTATNWQTTEWIVPYGSSTAMWGTTLTPAQVNASNFGIAFAAAGAAAGANRVANIDHAIMNVYYTVPSAIMLASSTNIATGGASTTAQLVSPGAFATSSFVGGHITDDQDLTPLVTTNAGRYTELEWNLIATGTATTGDAYQLRTTTINGEPLGDYRANALWTLGTYQTPGTFTLSGNLLNEYGTTTSPGSGVQVVAAINEDGNPVIYSTTTTAGGAYTLSVATATTPAANWNAVTVHGDNDMWRDVTYGNGRFVAVGGNTDGSPDNYLMYSDDGITWASTSASNSNDNWGAVTYGGGRFVAIANYGGGPLIYSDDGITWTDSVGVDLSGGVWLDVVYGDSMFVAVGSGMPVAYSYDGDTWATTTALGNNDTWIEVTYGNGRFVAVGDDTAGDGAMYSDDGITWTAGTISGSANIYSSVTYGQGRFVAGAGFDTDGPVMYSDDGITWTKVAGAPNFDWNAMTYANGRFVAASSNGRIMHSPNGIDWTLLSTTYNSLFTGLAYGNGRFVAVGCGGNTACGTAGTRAFFSDAGLGIDTGYTIYSNSSSSPATTFLMGASGASAQRADLFKNTLAIYNATTNAASSTTKIGNAAFYNYNNDSDVLYEFAGNGYFVAAADVLVATGTTETNLPMLTFIGSSLNNVATAIYDVRVLGTLDLTGGGLGTFLAGSLLGSLDITSGAAVRAKTLYVLGNYNNRGTFTNNDGSITFGGQMGYNTDVPLFISATSTASLGGDPQGLYFSADGMKFYYAGFGEVFEFTLDIPFDLSTGSLTHTLNTYGDGVGGDNFYITNESINFANNGRKLYVSGWQDDTVKEYTLTTPWSLSTATYVASTSLGTNNFTHDAYVSNNGRYLYATNVSNDQLRQYQLTTPYSIQSRTLVATTTFESPSNGFWISHDGEYMVRGSQYNPVTVERWRMSTPFDIRTMVRESDSDGHLNELAATSSYNGIHDIWMSQSGNKLAALTFVDIAAVYTLGAELSGNMTGSSSLATASFITGGKMVFKDAASTTGVSIDSAHVVVPTSTLEIAGNYTSFGEVFEQPGFDSVLLLTGSGNSINTFDDTQETRRFNNVVIDGWYSWPQGTTTVNNLTVNPGATLEFPIPSSWETGNSNGLVVQGNYTNNGTTTFGTTTVVSAANGYDVRGATFKSAYNVAAQTGTANGVAFSATGTYMYIVDETADQVFAYRLGVPWEVSTASYLYATSVAAYVANPEPRSLQFKPDGTRMYLSDWGNLLAEFSLSTPWDIRTATFVATTSPACCGFLDFTFSADGTKYYLVHASGAGFIERYTLSTPWTLSSATLNGGFIGRGMDYPELFAVSGDGLTLLVGINSNTARQFRMSTPHDLTTAVEVGDLDVSAIGDIQQQMTFNASGTKLYIVERANDEVVQYDLMSSSTFSGTMTGTSSFNFNLRASSTLPVLFNSAASTTNFNIAASSIVLAPTSTLLISGNFENRGTFIPRAGTTTLSGTNKTITGNLTSWNTTTNSPDYGLTNITGSYTVIGNATTSALTINSGASLTAPSGGTLTIAHDFTNNGTYTNNGATTTLGGNLRSGATGTSALGNTLVNARSQATEWQVLATSSAVGNNDMWTDITYGQGRFVAVGGNTEGSPDNFAAYSFDGISWTTTSASSNAWATVAYGNGIFVALSSYGGGPMMTSPDGITWTNRSPSGIGSTWSDITFGNGRFVAVGYSGTRVMYSDDGINWATTSAAGNNDNWFGVTYGDGKFVAVGNQFDGDAVMYSYDGVTWATTSVSGGGTSLYTKVVYGNGRFVAVTGYDEGGPVIYSFDGINWVKVPDAPNEDWNDVTYGNGRFVAVADSGDRLMYSTDGINWATTSVAGNDDYWTGIAYGNGRFVAVACGGNGGGCGTTGDRIITSLNTINLFQNASTSNLTINASSTLNASGTTVSVAGNYTNSGTLTASSSTFIFNGTSAQVATGTMSSSSKFFNLRLENTSGNGTTSRSVTFGTPLTASGTMTMIASTSAGFLANATTTLQNVSWQGNATSPVWLRSTATGTQWYLDIPGSQLAVDYVNVRDSNATPVTGGVTQTNSTDSGNNTNWNFGGTYVSSFQNGVNGYTGTDDTYLWADATTTNYGTSVFLDVDGAPETTSLLKWDISSLPSNAVVESAEIVFYNIDTGDDYGIYEALRPWTEAGATWNTYNGTNSWGTAGAKSIGTDIGSTLVTTFSGAGGGYGTSTLNASGIALVQDWIDGTKTNNGFAIQDHTKVSGASPDSSESATVERRPKLVVTYSLGEGGSSGPVAWNATDWTLYDTITIQEENIDADLTDFPVYVNLDDLSSTFWATTPTGSSTVGTDIRVTTNSNVEVPRELVFASSTAQTGELHFKAPSISSTTDTVFKIWYNGTTTGDYADTATYGAENVWTNNYVAVLHLQEEGNTTASGYQDSTGNGFNGTGVAMTSTSDISGRVGKAQDFDGSTQYIDLASSAVLGSSTLSAWVNIASADLEACDGVIFSRETAVAGVNLGGCYDGARVGYHWDDVYYDWTSGPVISTNQWSYIALAVENATATTYNNLTSVTNVAAHATSVILDDIRIGEDENLSRRINGAIDEVRIASTSRSAAWVKAEYYNQSTSTDFYSVNLTAAVGSSTLAENLGGQVSNAFNSQNVTDGELYAFRVIPNSGIATATDIEIEVTGAHKVNPANFSNFRIVLDDNRNGQFDGGDIGLVHSGTFTLNGQRGSILFTDANLNFTGSNVLLTTSDFLVVADWTAPANGTFMTLQLRPAGLTLVDNDGTQQIFGSVSSRQHFRNNKGGGGGSGAIGGDAPSGQGNQTGGGGTGGQLIGDDPSFRWPTADSGSWSTPANAYDRTDGTYATTNAANTHVFNNHTFGVPTGNVITGIEVKLEVSGSTGQGTINAELSWNGGTNYTTPKTTPTMTASDVVVSLGGPTDLWGRSWNAAEFADANFRVRLTGAPVSNTLRVDAIQVRVYHQAGGGGGGGGGEI